MFAGNVLAFSLVLIGLFQLLIGLFYVVRISQRITVQRTKWKVLAILICGFVVGYLVFAQTVLNETASELVYVVAFVFCFGGTFVLLVARLSADTIDDVTHVAALQLENERIWSMQRKLQTILDNTADGIIVFDDRGKIEGFNRKAEEMFGFDEAEVIGKDICGVMSPHGFVEHDNAVDQKFDPACLETMIGGEHEVFGRHRVGRIFPVALKVSASAIESRRLFTAIACDITERKAMLERLTHMAEHDALTGLYNRSYFLDVLANVIARCNAESEDHCLLYIDLDNFKQVNDGLGHAAGDELLRDVSRIIASKVRKSHLAARMGGDEFVVLLTNASVDQGVAAAEALRRRLARYVVRGAGQAIDIGCSIGVAPITRETTSGEEALSKADDGCRLAKCAGRNRVHLFRPGDCADAGILSSVSTVRTA